MNHSSPEFIEALSQLVATPSVSSTQPDIDLSNIDVVNLLANWLDNMGFDTRVQALANSGKANLYARLGPDRPGGLVFSGHLDTVPCDPALWSSNPFAITATDLGYRGLGSTDMKGFFAVLVQSLKQFKAGQLSRPISLVATADEESTMSGARALQADAIETAAAVIIGEPTDMAPVYMHKGIMMEAIRISGTGGHSSDPRLGLNAMEVMQDVIAGLLQLRAQLQSQHHNAAFAVQVPTLNLGCIHGGDNPNRICSHCEVQFDLRTLPGQVNNSVRAQIDHLIDEMQARWNCPIERISLFEGVEAFEQARDSDLVRLAETTTGQPAKAVSFATEAPFFKALGAATIILGPGSINQAHRVDEYIPAAQIDPAINLYARMIQSYCIDSK